VWKVQGRELHDYCTSVSGLNPGLLLHLKGIVCSEEQGLFVIH